jgi:hypothetical protein
MLRHTTPTNGYTPIGYPNTRIYRYMRAVKTFAPTHRPDTLEKGATVTYEGEDFGVHYFTDELGRTWGMHAHQIELYLTLDEWA